MCHGRAFAFGLLPVGQYNQPDEVSGIRIHCVYRWVIARLAASLHRGHKTVSADCCYQATPLVFGSKYEKETL